MFYNTLTNTITWNERLDSELSSSCTWTLTIMHNYIIRQTYTNSSIYSHIQIQYINIITYNHKVRWLSYTHLWNHDA